MPNRPLTAEQIFHDARAIASPGPRELYLQAACAGNADLRAKVDKLLRAHDAANAGDFLKTGPAHDQPADAANAETSATPADAPGSLVGPYKLLELLGEGGFGAVWRAEQREPISRHVAIKIIKPGMDSRMVLARFEAERQALALMDHPHIATVLDAGMTDAGKPYFVMEYVKGDPITDFAAAHKLPIKARLALFTQVCHAVQHAHTKGVIHRDLKPANILTIMSDGRPHAKVIDFGIAKSLAGRLTQKTLFTEHRQLIGTPEYMSPEQAEGSLDIDTRTDVYALGVLLYELLTGETPFDARRLRSAAIAEMQRILKEEDPPTPSLRLERRLPLQYPSQREGQGEGLSSSSPPTQSPSPLPSPARPQDLRGELDWIVMKALDKDRARRYDTPLSFAQDLARYLTGEPVHAAPPSTAYKVRKFVRKHKGKVITAGAVAATLVLGIAGTTWGLWRADRANQSLQDKVTIAKQSTQQVAGDLLADETREANLAQIREDVRAKFPAADQDEVEIRSLAGIANWGVNAFKHERRRLSEKNAELLAQADAAEWGAYKANLDHAQRALAASDYPLARDYVDNLSTTRTGWEAKILRRFADNIVIALPGYYTKASISTDGILTIEYATPDRRSLRYSLEKPHAGRPINSQGTDLTMVEIDINHYYYNEPVLGSLSDAVDRIVPLSNLRWAQHSGQRVFNRPPSMSIHFNDGRNLAILSSRNHPSDPLQLFDLIASKPLAEFCGYGHDLHGVEITNNGEWVLSFSVPNGAGGWSDPRVTVFDVAQCGGPEIMLHADVHYYGKPSQIRDMIRLRIAAILESCNLQSLSGLTLTTPDGTRIIKGSADRTVRFYEAKDGKPTLPATAESPESVYREVAVFRMDDAVTNLQMTGDGTRLIISLADGSARVWDIRDPEERRADLQREWAERGPAGEYLDALWARPISTLATDAIHDTIVNDPSLTPLRRLVAAEMLQEKLADLSDEANAAFDEITKDQTDAETVRAKAKAADLPERVKQKVIAAAEKWENKAPEPSAEEKLAEETKQRRLEEANRQVQEARLLGTSDGDEERERELMDSAVTTLTEILGPDDARTIKARWRRLEFQWASWGRDPKVRDVAIAWLDVEHGTDHSERDFREAYVDASRWLRSPEQWAGPQPRSESLTAMAHYRLSNYPAALSAVTRAAELRAQTHEPPHPADLSLLAMIHYQLSTAPAAEGDAAAPSPAERGQHLSLAREALTKARAIMADPANAETWAKDADAKALFAEAEALIEGTAPSRDQPPSKKK